MSLWEDFVGSNKSNTNQDFDPEGLEGAPMLSEALGTTDLSI